MRRPPPWTEFTRYPVVGGTIVLALAVTLASWSGKVDVTPLFETVDIRRGQLWRLLTSALPHGSLLHLVFNAYWTWAFGTLVEEIFGHLKTLAIFILLAVVANGAEYAVLEGGIGLSGIGYGLFGLLWVLSCYDRRFSEAIDKQTIGLFVVWFFICIVLTLTVFPIANVAHGMGAVAGAMLGWTISTSSRRRLLASAALTVLVASVLLGDTIARPWINLSPNRGEDEAKLGYDDLMADRNAEALRWYRDATRMQPQMADYWFKLGIAYERLNRQADAMASFKRARDLEPSNADYQAAVQDNLIPGSKPTTTESE